MLKHIFFFLATTILSSNLFAGLPVFEGTYMYRNDSKIIQKKLFEIVDIGTTKGKARYNQLLNQRYSCYNQGSNIFQCSTFTLNPSTIDIVALKEAVNKSNQLILNFDNSSSTPILTNDAESIKEWTYNQKVSLNEIVYENFKLLDLGTVQKISLGEPTLASFIVKGKYLAYLTSTMYKLDANRAVLITIESYFEN